MPLHRAAVAVALLLVTLALAAGCKKTDHEAIDDWMSTEKGPGKLKDALADGSLDPDLSAHAAQNLLLIGDDTAVRDIFEKMSPERRAKVLPKLAPRLWELARVEGELTAPSGQQYAAKDLLFALRKHADDATRTTIDGYLIEWFTGGYYEGRAPLGSASGAVVLRALGASAGPKMVSAANAVIGAAPTKDGRRLRIGDELLLGLAVTGHPDAVKYVLDIGAMDRGDPTLAERSISALYKAYVEPPGQMFARGDPAGLSPNVAAIARIIRSDDSSNRMINDAIAVLGAAGMPECLEPLVAMIGMDRGARFRWVAANNALRCGQLAGIDEVAAALPTSASYEKEAMAGSVVGEIARMSPPEQALATSRELLGHQSWVARWIGIEVVGKLGAKADADRLDALAGDKARLAGYWGDQSDLPKKERKPEPTVGKRAAELAAVLRGGP